MGRHEAVDGAATHPLVAQALHRRLGAGQEVRGEPALPGREGPIGWPGPDPDPGGEPVGWPGGPREPDAEEGNAGPTEASAPPPEGRSGWRRLLGRPHAA